MFTGTEGRFPCNISTIQYLKITALTEGKIHCDITHVQYLNILPTRFIQTSFRYLLSRRISCTTTVLVTCVLSQVFTFHASLAYLVSVVPLAQHAVRPELQLQLEPEIESAV